MGRTDDLARVAKGARKVVQALVQSEGVNAASRLVQLRVHGVGVAASVKDAVSSAVSSAGRPTTPSPGTSNNDASNSVHSTLAANTSQRQEPPSYSGIPTLQTPRSDGNSMEVSDSTTPHGHPSSFNHEPTGEALHREGLMRIETTAVALDEDSAKPTAAPLQGQGIKQGVPDTPSDSLASRDREGVELKGEVREEGMQSSAKSKWDVSGPWNYAGAAAAESGGEPAGSGEGTRPDGLSSASGPTKSGMSSSRTRTVPSSPLARVFGFGQLAAGLAMGTVAEAMRQSVGGAGGEGRDQDGRGGRRKQGGKVKQYVVSDANAERLAETLCRMRGAALKLGQMLSIQDESIIPPSLAKALDRVRQGADVMPARQLHKQLEKSLGADWRDRLASFDEVPIAAASIGQVHRATLLDGTEVAMKIQYPGVADSVESDLTNLHRLVQLTNILPPGLYIEEIIKVAREELGEECDYEREAVNQERFRVLVESDPGLSKWASVPRVVPELLSKEVLTTHLVTGVPVDHVLPMPQEVRNHVARLMLRCTINELFDWRFMQTDPNWGNFLFDQRTGKMSLIDFGACREYRKDFVDDYLKLVWSAANRDQDEIMRVSKELQFLTGDETQAMMRAHVQAGLVVGEPFVDRDGEPFDFHGSNITARLSQHGDTFMKHRLTPPPREAYSLHRKLAGAFLMNIKLKATIPCRDILEDVHNRYTFG